MRHVKGREWPDILHFRRLGVGRRLLVHETLDVLFGGFVGVVDAGLVLRDTHVFVGGPESRDQPGAVFAGLDDPS